MTVVSWNALDRAFEAPKSGPRASIQRTEQRKIGLAMHFHACLVDEVGGQLLGKSSSAVLDWAKLAGVAARRGGSSARILVGGLGLDALEVLLKRRSPLLPGTFDVLGSPGTFDVLGSPLPGTFDVLGSPLPWFAAAVALVALNLPRTYLGEIPSPFPQE